MKREDVLKEMKESIGTRDPIEFFANLTNIFTLLFDRLDQLEGQLNQVKTQSALAIYWDPRVASDLLAREVKTLRDQIGFDTEIAAFKKAFAEDLVTQNYSSFCTFWQDTLGFHPFLD